VLQLAGILMANSCLFSYLKYLNHYLHISF